MKLINLFEYNTGYQYYHSCVDWPPHDVNAEGGLVDMIDMEEDITRKQFIDAIGQSEYDELESNLGYDGLGGLTMKSDYHVQYFTSKLHGYQVFYVKHSAIEYVYVPSDYPSH